MPSWKQNVWNVKGEQFGTYEHKDFERKTEFYQSLLWAMIVLSIETCSFDDENDM